MLSTAYCPPPTVSGRRHPSPATRAGGIPAAVDPDRVRAVLAVDSMPKTLRLTIEHAMSVCLKSDPEDAPIGADPFDLGWCTRWTRQPGGLTACRQAITGTSVELDRLSAIVEGLARAHHFRASVRLV